jgi:hypothetical protein
VYALLTNRWLLLSIGFLVGGFTAINRFGMSSSSLLHSFHLLVQLYLTCLLLFLLCASNTAPEATQVGDRTITQKHLYTGLFVIGIPAVWWASPIATFFWLVGASSILILGHAMLLEPGIESEYATVSESV